MESKKFTWLPKVVVAVLGVVVLFVLVSASYWGKQISYLFEKESSVDAPADFTETTSEQKSTPDRIIIERLKIEAPIIYAEVEDEEMFQEALRDGVVHYPRTADIGQSGNAYLFGHSSDYVWAKGDYKSVFALLPKINIGEEIVVTDREGRQFVYRVFETKVVKPDEVAVLDDQATPRKLLTIQTSYPVGTVLRRFIVMAELVEK